MTFGAATDSAIFGQYIADAVAGAAGYTGWEGRLDGDFKVALFNSTTGGATRPNRMALAPAYNAGDWLLANEVVDTVGANWPAGGRPLLGPTPPGTGPVFTFPLIGDIPPFLNLAGAGFDAEDTEGAGVVTIDDACGDLLYLPTIGSYTNQACAMHSFGGPNSVAGGLFTILWHAAGLMIVTVQGTPTGFP